MGAPILTLLAALVWLAAVLFFRKNRIWLLYYVTGSVGLALLLIFAGVKWLPLAAGMEYATAYAGHALSNLVGIPTYLFRAAPNNIFVWVVEQTPGWTVVRVDLECSGMLEIATWIGLLLFYPDWTLARRLWLIGIGAVGIFGANLVRVVAIITILHLFGKHSIVIAHTLIGRLLFFGLVMLGMYWYVFSRLTIHSLADRITARMRA